MLKPWWVFASLLFLCWDVRATAQLTSRWDEVSAAAEHYYLDPALVFSVIAVESQFNPRATSPKDAKGLMQLMPQTAVKERVASLYHTSENLMGGCRLLRKLLNRYHNHLPLALAAYNAGVAAVERYQGVPPFPETQHYVEKVLAHYARYRMELHPK